MATTTAELEIRTTLKDDASKQVEGMGSSFGKLTAAIGLGNLAAVGFQKATSFLTNTIKGSIKAAQDAEVSQSRVNAIVKTLTGSLKDNTEAIELASDTALNLGFDDEVAAESMAKLLQVTKDTTKAQEAFETAMDLARFKGIELDEASQAITMALNGNVRVLKQLGIDVPENASKMEILGLVHTRVAGQAEAFGNTSAGAALRFKNSMENLQESIGARVLPIVSKFFDSLSGFVSSNKLQDWIEQIIKLYNDFLAPVINDKLIPAFKSFAESIRPHIPLIQQVLKVLFGVAGAALIGTLEVLSIALTASGKIFDFVADKIENIIADIKQLIEWIQKAIGPVKEFAGAVGGVAGKVGGGIGGAAGNVGNFFKDIFRAEGGPVSAGRGYVVGEQGPEFFMPKQNGTIIPGGAGNVVTVNFNNPTVRSEQDLTTIVGAVRSVLNRELQLANLGVS